jgi:hypothetical protein
MMVRSLSDMSDSNSRAISQARSSLASPRFTCDDGNSFNMGYRSFDLAWPVIEATLLSGGISMLRSFRATSSDLTAISKLDSAATLMTPA